MSFYDDWLQCIQLQEDDSDYIEAFLRKKDYSTRVFYCGNKEQIAIACKILINYDLDVLINFLCDEYKNILDPSKVIQFSNFENATTNIVQLLYDKEGGLTYPEIGRSLAGSIETNAATKYGENHSKLARDFELVKISEQRPSIVRISNFGKCFAFLDKDEQIKILKILGLRDPLIQNLIIKSKSGIAYYSEECSCLSESTKIRRRSNVKKLFELIFENLDNSLVNNIIW